jgi:hypothetical protein
MDINDFVPVTFEELVENNTRFKSEYMQRNNLYAPAE